LSFRLFLALAEKEPKNNIDSGNLRVPVAHLKVRSSTAHEQLWEIGFFRSLFRRAIVC
jgi:hypothetical protein